MADIRIKDLTTTASSTASDDFIAVDGTTNGTRKLSAFSPTFGGNATVTGTLTVNGTTASVGAGTGSIISKLNGAAGSYKLSIYQSAGVDRWYAGLAAGAESGSDGGAPYSIVALTDAGAVIDNALLITRAAGGSITTPRPVSISATTASTSTSTGALVVSGGLGVGGAMNVGNQLKVTNATIPDLWLQNTSGATSAYRNILIRQNSDDTFKFLSTSDAGVLSKDNILTGSNANGAIGIGVTPAAGASSLTVAGVIKTNDTTASTSTSSGALVVSGGVGVAGAIYGGGDIISSGNGNIQGGRFTSVNSNSYIEQSGTDFTYVTGGSRPHVFSIGGTTRFQVTTSGIISSLPASAASLTVNSTMTFELTSNTSLKIFVRGSDGTTRSTTLTLA